ncbi:MAG: hypothetical protein ACOY4K_12090 [Pseudomonadota bacterium]
MFHRLPLIAAGALGLCACDMADLRLQPAPLQQAACCCRQCPTEAAPAATPQAAPPARAAPAPRRAAWRGRPARPREAVVYTYDSAGELAGGGRYGGRYGATAVRVEETAAVYGYSYSETSGGYGYAAPAPGCCETRRGYRMAGVDAHGYLTWPGKVEN